MKRIAKLINQFLEWAGYAEKKQEIDIAKMTEDPMAFPYFLTLRNECISMINTSLDEEELYAFLFCMAIDNESEIILDSCKTYASDAFLQQIISFGITFPQSETRWQIAELLQKDIPRKKEYLERLLCDENAYVRKRASNIMGGQTNY